MITDLGARTLSWINTTALDASRVQPAGPPAPPAGARPSFPAVLAALLLVLVMLLGLALTLRPEWLEWT